MFLFFFFKVARMCKKQLPNHISKIFWRFKIARNIFLRLNYKKIKFGT